MRPERKNSLSTHSESKNRLGIFMTIPEEEIKNRIEKLPNWRYENDSLVRQFEFENFLQAVDFVVKIAPMAEEMQHHPDIQIKNYNQVVIGLTTHDEGGVTDLDFELAEKIDQVTEQ